MASDDEYHRRTLITRLELRSKDDEQLLLDTIDEWRDGCNIGSNLAWETCHTKSDVRNHAKETIKKQTELGDQHATLACHEVAGAIKSCIGRRKQAKKATQPQFTSRSMVFDRRTLTVFPRSREDHAHDARRPLQSPCGSRAAGEPGWLPVRLSSQRRVGIH